MIEIRDRVDIVILESAQTYGDRAEEHRRLRDEAAGAGNAGMRQHHATQANIADDFIGICARLACFRCSKPISERAQSWFWRAEEGDLRMHLSCFREWYQVGLENDLLALKAYDDAQLRILSDGD